MHSNHPKSFYTFLIANESELQTEPPLAVQTQTQFSIPKNTEIHHTRIPRIHFSLIFSFLQCICLLVANCANLQILQIKNAHVVFAQA